MTDLHIGDPRVNAVSGSCCGKPVGCTMKHDGCVFLRHPWKRAMVFNDLTVRCQATAIRDGRVDQCPLLNGHAGGCESSLGPEEGVKG